MNFRKLLSRAVSVLSALAVLNEALTPEQLDSIHPHASTALAIAGVAGLLTTEASVKIGAILEAARKRRGAAASLALLAAVCFFGMGASKCGGAAQTVRGVSAGIVEGSKQFKSELAALESAGDITGEERAAIEPIADELSKISGGFVTRAAGWNALTRAERVELAGDAVDEIGASVERLSAQNLLVKNPRAKAKLAERLRYARIAVSTLRVIKASLPAPAPAPAATS
jgi:hypothetical protein